MKISTVSIAILLTTMASCLAIECQNNKYPISFEKLRLLNHVITAKTSPSHASCASSCHLKIGCMSINFNPRTKYCELNNATALSDPGNVDTSPANFVYNDIEQWPQNRLKLKKDGGEQTCEPYKDVLNDSHWALKECGIVPVIENATISGSGFTLSANCITFADGIPCYSIGKIQCIDNQWTPFTCTDIPRVCGGNGPTRGRLEFYIDGAWGTVCIDHFDLPDVTVACAELGFKYGGSFHTPTAYGEGSGTTYKLDKLLCTGDELKLTDCFINKIDPDGCNHDKDIGLTCYATPMTGSNLRIVDALGNSGPDVLRGRPEVFFDGEWGTICDKGWNGDAADAFCKTINPAWERDSDCNNACEGEGSGKIWTSELDCSSNDDDIFLCLNYGWGILHPDCEESHSNDVGVECKII